MSLASDPFEPLRRVLRDRLDAKRHRGAQARVIAATGLAKSVVSEFASGKKDLTSAVVAQIAAELGIAITVHWSDEEARTGPDTPAVVKQAPSRLEGGADVPPQPNADARTSDLELRKLRAELRSVGTRLVRLAGETSRDHQKDQSPDRPVSRRRGGHRSRN